MDQRLARKRRGQQGGFTIIEVLIALLVLVVGFAGILSLQLTAMRATSFSRHATEASVLAEDKMEQLRTISGFVAPLMLEGTAVDTTQDGQPAVSTVVVQKYNGKGYETAETFG